MSVELSVVAACITLALGLLAGSRNWKKDTQDATSQMTTVIVKLESIQCGVSEIKNDISNVKEEMKQLDHRLTINEQKTGAALDRIDEFKKIH